MLILSLFFDAEALMRRGRPLLPFFPAQLDESLLEEMTEERHMVEGWDGLVCVRPPSCCLVLD